MLLLSCGAQVAEAPFPARPDTVAPGDLRGPFDGQVLDQATGNPLSGALVFAAWAYERLGPLTSPLTAITSEIVTKSDGTYEVPRHDTLDQPGVVLRRFTLLCYKSGYLGYRSDLRYEGPSPRHDFAQHGNRIRLERFPEGESHARHLAFLGGGDAVRRAAQTEQVLAALELTDAQQPRLAPKVEVPPPPPPLPEAGELLTQADLQEVTGAKIAFLGEPLPDTVVAPNQAPASGGQFGPAPAPAPMSSKEGVDYRGWHLRAQGKIEAFDAGLRVWRALPDKKPGPRAGTSSAALREQKTAAPAALREQKAAAPAALREQKNTRLSAEALFDILREDLRKVLGKVRESTDVGNQSLRAFDAKRRIYGVAALLPGPGVVVQLSCGASLCKREDVAVKLLQRVIQRLAPTAEPAKGPAQDNQLKLKVP